MKRRKIKKEDDDGDDDNNFLLLSVSFEETSKAVIDEGGCVEEKFDLSLLRHRLRCFLFSIFILNHHHDILQA
jgi:hypothetical protein